MPGVTLGALDPQYCCGGTDEGIAEASRLGACEGKALEFAPEVNRVEVAEDQDPPAVAVMKLLTYKFQVNN